MCTRKGPTPDSWHAAVQSANGSPKTRITVSWPSGDEEQRSAMGAVMIWDKEAALTLKTRFGLELGLTPLSQPSPIRTQPR